MRAEDPPLSRASRAARARLLCARELETDQARLCRMALPALAPADADVVDPQPDARTPTGAASRRLSRRRRGGAAAHLAHCRFQRPGRPLHSDRSRRRSRSTARRSASRGCYFLIRFWLATPEGARRRSRCRSAGIEDLPRVSPRAPMRLQQALNALPLDGGLRAARRRLFADLRPRRPHQPRLRRAGGGGRLWRGVRRGAAGSARRRPMCSIVGRRHRRRRSAPAGASPPARRRSRRCADASGQQTLVATVGLVDLPQRVAATDAGRARRTGSRRCSTRRSACARAGDFVVTTSADALFSAAVALAAGVALVWRHALEPLRPRVAGLCRRCARRRAVRRRSRRRCFCKTFALASALAGLAGFVMTMFYGARRLRRGRHARPEVAGRRHPRRHRLDPRRADRRPDARRASRRPGRPFFRSTIATSPPTRCWRCCWRCGRAACSGRAKIPAARWA